MLDFADVIAINKFDQKEVFRCYTRCKKQYQRNHQLWDKNQMKCRLWHHCSQFNDDQNEPVFIKDYDCVG